MAISKKEVGIGCGMLLLGIVAATIYIFKQFSQMMSEMKAKSVMKQAYQIHQALFAYAQSHDGKFPALASDDSKFETSNDAFRELFRAGLLDDERLFFVQGSGWHGITKPDGNIGSEATDFREALAKHENHFAYVSGLNTETNAATPLVMDGFVPGSELRWSDDSKEKGGVWKGRYTLTVRVNGTAKVDKLDDAGHVMDSIDGKLKNISQIIEQTPRAKVLNPDG